MNFFNLFLVTGKKLAKSWSLFIYSALIIAMLFGISKIAQKIVPSFAHAWQAYSWFIGVSIISIAALAFIFTEMIGLSIAEKNKGNFEYRKFFLRNFAITLIVIIIGIIIQQASTYIALKVGKFAGLDILHAKFIFLGLYGLGLLCILIFLSFASFYCIKDNLNIRDSIKKSINFVRANYIKTLLSITIIYLFWEVIGLLPKYGSVFGTIIVTPILAVWFSELIKRPEDYNL